MAIQGVIKIVLVFEEFLLSPFLKIGTMRLSIHGLGKPN
jgi:hypothetical protein